MYPFQARPCFKDKTRYIQLVDPALHGRYPWRCFQHFVAIVAICLQEVPAHRPLISDVAVALEYLASHQDYSK